VLKKLLELGFLIQFDNFIHLKLYITDNEAYVSSSNLTESGFEKNKELTVKVDSSNIQRCIYVFNEIWSSCSENKLTYEFIQANWAKYELLLIRDKNNNAVQKKILIKKNNIEGIDLDKIYIEVISRNNFSINDNDVFEANKKRERLKEMLLKNFNLDLFYVPENHPLRRDNLFYDFAYGFEYRLAGTGLHEAQYKEAFEHPLFEKVINYIYPEMLESKPWNLNDKEELQRFCNGLFSFPIPQFSVTLPIRLASYFYPNFFLPIFNLEHLKGLCEDLGLEANLETKGDKLYVYNTFLADKLKAIPYNNYVKSDIAYLLYYTIELFQRIKKGEEYQNILNSYPKKWMKNYINEGNNILKSLEIYKN
jgi:hypothetical protein